MLLTINGINLNVEIAGAGQPLVLLHGLTLDITSLQPEIDRFSQSYQTVAIDSRGHGRSDKPAHFTLQDHIDDVLGVMDALGLDRVYLIGISMGSYTAQGLATQQPQRIAKLVLITPKAQGKTSSSARLLAEHAAEVQGMSAAEVQAFLIDKLFAPTTPAVIKRSMFDYAQRQADDGLALTPEQNLAANRALEGFDFRPVLPLVTAETLVISGLHDPLNPPENGREIADLIPDAQFVVLQHSGHVPTLEEPERLLKVIDDFLKR